MDLEEQKHSLNLQKNTQLAKVESMKKKKKKKKTK